MLKLLACGASLIALALSVAARAQAARAQDQLPIQPTAANPDKPAAVDANKGAIADIVVTATRRPERLQHIPVTVTAITAATLARSGIADTRSLTDLVPGLTYTRAASLGQPVIRGVGSTGTSNGDESNIATYIDGVYQADPYATMIELVNVDRVEVLRGPQGTVFGRNATGGLINVITSDPTFTPHGTATATYARLRNDANDVDLRGYLTGGLTRTIAASVSGLYKRNDDYVQDLLRGGTIGHNEVYAVRGKLLYQPSSRAKIILTADYSHQNGQSGVYGAFDNYTRGRTVAGYIPTNDPWQIATDVLPIFNYQRFSISLRTSFDLNFAHLETTGAYNFAHTTQFNDGDGSNIPVSAAFPIIRSRTYSQEVRLLSNSGGAFTWLLGGYAFYLDSPANIVLYNSPAPPAPLIATVTLAPIVTTRSFAGFGEGTYALTDKLFLTGGLRYTTERRTFFSELNGNPFLPTPGSTTRAERSYDKLTYRAAVRYQFTPHANIYASYGTGFKSGVFNTVATRLNVVDPENIKAIEVGMKNDISHAVRLNLSGYNYNYDNLQVNARDPSGSGAFVLQNAAKAHIYGGEAELTLAPTHDFSVSSFVTYAHARYTSFLGAQVFLPSATGANLPSSQDVSGKNLVRTPSFTFNIRPDWRHDLGKGEFEASATLFHSTRVYWDFANTPAFSQQPYTMVNGDLSYQLNRWRFGLNATNLFNERVAQQIQVSAAGAIALFERPRRIAVSLGYVF